MRLRDELLHGEIFHSFQEAHVLLEAWRHHDHAIRLYSSLGYRGLPAPESIVPSHGPSGSCDTTPGR